jgi:toluene monooxygenase system protein A
MCQLPILGTPGKGWNVKDYPLEYNGRLYHFGSEVDRWVFEQEPERYAGHMSIVDRFLAGMIQPMNLEGALAYMNLAPGEMGDDAHNYAWAEVYNLRAQEGRLVAAGQPACRTRGRAGPRQEEITKWHCFR